MERSVHAVMLGDHIQP